MSTNENGWTGKGGPPKIPPILGVRAKIYPDNMEIKIDRDGRAYSGMSIEELQKCDQIKQPKI